MKLINKIYVIAIAVICIVVVVVVVKACNFAKTEHVVSQTVAETKPTPVNLDSLKRIGQWSVVTVELEQSVDTVDKGFFHDTAIELLYRGTLHYGVDMMKVKDDWVRVVDDSVAIVTLPEVQLLDDRFLDERNVKVILGDGDEKFINRPEVKEALVRKAKAEMIRQGDTHKPEAKKKIEDEITRLFSSHGFTVRVKWR